jgi:hypothetical protein
MKHHPTASVTPLLTQSGEEKWIDTFYLESCETMTRIYNSLPIDLYTLNTSDNVYAMFYFIAEIVANYMIYNLISIAVTLKNINQN